METKIKRSELTSDRSQVFLLQKKNRKKWSTLMWQICDVASHSFLGTSTPRRGCGSSTGQVTIVHYLFKSS